MNTYPERGPQLARPSFVPAPLLTSCSSTSPLSSRDRSHADVRSETRIRPYSTSSHWNSDEENIRALQTSTDNKQVKTITLSASISESSPVLNQLTHNGEANMVPTRHKSPTNRTTISRARLHFMHPSTYSLIREHRSSKGDVIAVARVAGILAAKNTSRTIPLCHPINISSVEIDFQFWGEEGRGGGESGIDIEVTVKSLGTSGLEMESLCAVSVAGLTIYDMCKKVDRGIMMSNVRVVFKSGGRAGDWKEESWTKLITSDKPV